MCFVTARACVWHASQLELGGHGEVDELPAARRRDRAGRAPHQPDRPPHRVHVSPLQHTSSSVCSGVCVGAMRDVGVCCFVARGRVCPRPQVTLGNLGLSAALWEPSFPSASTHPCFPSPILCLMVARPCLCLPMTLQAPAYARPAWPSPSARYALCVCLFVAVYVRLRPWLGPGCVLQVANLSQSHG